MDTPEIVTIRSLEAIAELPVDRMRTQWFEEKATQVEPYTITAFGIQLFSRYGNALEFIEMLKFAKLAARNNLAHLIKELFYDSKACICSFEFTVSELSYGEEAALFACAEECIDQFMWVDGCAYCKRD